MNTTSNTTGTVVGRITAAVFALLLSLAFTILPGHVVSYGASFWLSLAADTAGGVLAACAFLVALFNIGSAVTILRGGRHSRRRAAGAPQRSIELVATRVNG